MDAEQGTRPIGGLCEQVLPGHLAVVLAVESGIPDVGRNPVIQVADELVVVGESCNRRKVALGDAEGHVGAVDVTPLGDDVSVFDDHARRSAAMACGSGESVVGLATEAAEDGETKVYLDRVLVVLGYLDRLIDELVAETEL